MAADSATMPWNLPASEARFVRVVSRMQVLACCEDARCAQLTRVGQVGQPARVDHAVRGVDDEIRRRVRGEATRTRPRARHARVAERQVARERACLAGWQRRQQQQRQQRGDERGHGCCGLNRRGQRALSLESGPIAANAACGARAPAAEHREGDNARRARSGPQCSARLASLQCVESQGKRARAPCIGANVCALSPTPCAHRGARLDSAPSGAR